MTARELEQLLTDQFGPDFRRKAIIGPMGSFRLADAFAECGLEDPSRPITCGANIPAGAEVQIDASGRAIAVDPVANARAALALSRFGQADR